MYAEDLIKNSEII